MKWDPGGGTNESLQYFRASILARRAFERLRQSGHSEGQARQWIEAAIASEEFAVRQGRHSFDLDRFSERLNQLPS